MINPIPAVFSRYLVRLISILSGVDQYRDSNSASPWSLIQISACIISIVDFAGFAFLGLSIDHAHGSRRDAGQFVSASRDRHFAMRSLANTAKHELLLSIINIMRYMARSRSDGGVSRCTLRIMQEKRRHNEPMLSVLLVALCF